jgi:hypothetical protein
MASKFLLALALALAACTAGVCARNSDCPAGEICSIEGMCETGGPIDPNEPPVCDAATCATTTTTTTTADAAVDASVDGGD